MSINNILAEIDAEIARLQQVRTLLAPTATGKPKKAKTATPAKKRRKLSKEGRARIVAALKKRWAEKKKADKQKAPF
ncbi:MAG: hypothetical protein WCA10_05355 [Terracidiphilus sp.]